MKRDGMGRPIQGVRGESGLTVRQELNIVGRGLMWPTSQEGRRSSVNLLESVIAGRTGCEIADQIKAIEVYMKADAMNLMAEKAAEEKVGEGKGGERLVYLLPENGSEKVKGDFEGDGDVVLSDHNWAEASVEAERESQNP